MQRNQQLLITGCLAAAAILTAAWIVIVRIEFQHSEDLPTAATSEGASAQADEEAALRAAEPIDAKMIGYHEAGSFSVGLHEPTAVAVTTNDEIYVGGDRAVQHYSGDGKKLAEIALRGEPKCLAVGGLDDTKATRIYVGMENHVEVYEPQGRRLAVWGSRGGEALFTSMATTDNEIWVADAGNRIVWRFNAAGKLLEPVGQADPARHRTGFLVTSHYFDLAAGVDDLVYVVNPRLLHVESYTHGGEYEAAWGKGSPSVADFFGCCNPAQLAVLPNGCFVTAEKGIPRVKVYSRSGIFQTVVAGPSQLVDTPTDLAADRRGRVLVLEGRTAKVRIFERNSQSEAATK
jgi:hypothetical protein